MQNLNSRPQASGEQGVHKHIRSVTGCRQDLRLPNANSFSIEWGDTKFSPRCDEVPVQSIGHGQLDCLWRCDPETKWLTFVGPKGETTLLQFAGGLGWKNWEENCGSAEIMLTV